MLARLLLCFIVAAAVHAKGGSACSDGTCSESDLIGGIITPWTGGKLTLGQQVYTSKDGLKTTLLLNKIASSAGLMDKLEEQCQQSASDARTEAISQTALGITTQMIEGGLLQLALVHREEWTHLALDAPLDEEADEDVEKNDKAANSHFEKAINAYEVLLQVYSQLWKVMTPGACEGLPAFSLYDREALSSGQSSIYVQMADLYHSRYNHIHTEETAGDCVVAYRHLLQGEEWCDKSLSLLGVDLEGTGEEEDVVGGRMLDHSAIVEEVTQAMALIQVRLGALLIDMYVAGYCLDADGNLLLEPLVFDETDPYENLLLDHIRPDQQRILDRTLGKLTRGSQLYNALATENSAGVDYRLNIADSGHYKGLAHSHLFQWSEAVEELEKSMAIYEQLLDEYLASGWIPESLEVTNGMIQTTQGLWESYLNLQGKTAEAEKIFQRHLVLRRYVEEQVPFEESLADNEGRGDAYHQQPIDDGGEDYQESLQAYQKLLEEYMQSISDYGPDGSVYELGFDAYEGIAAESYVQSDKVYEGTMRSSIGSLHLAQQNLFEAKGELELAVALLRQGLYDGRATFDAYGEDDELIQYSVKLELANALLNLAYAELGLRLWASSLESFEQAMELYESELSGDETPMGHSGGSDRGKDSSWGERLTSFFKSGAGDKSSNDRGDGEGGQNNDDSTQGIDLSNFQMMENATENDDYRDEL
ncbi:hypothetical protein ACHAXT_011497 [Thalassiosira profunda]